jgi:hypothetical protein
VFSNTSCAWKARPPSSSRCASTSESSGDRAMSSGTPSTPSASRGSGRPSSSRGRALRGRPVASRSRPRPPVGFIASAPGASGAYVHRHPGIRHRHPAGTPRPPCSSPEPGPIPEPTMPAHSPKQLPPTQSAVASSQPSPLEVGCGSNPLTHDDIDWRECSAGGGVSRHQGPGRRHRTLPVRSANRPAIKASRTAAAVMEPVNAAGRRRGNSGSVAADAERRMMRAWLVRRYEPDAPVGDLHPVAVVAVGWGWRQPEPWDGGGARSSRDEVGSAWYCRMGAAW